MPPNAIWHFQLIGFGPAKALSFLLSVSRDTHVILVFASLALGQQAHRPNTGAGWRVFAPTEEPSAL